MSPTLLNGPIAIDTHRALQIIHPFYVFQIASVILWLLDAYWYYAFCIVLISAFSVTTTLIETKKVGMINIRREIEGRLLSLDHN